MSPGRSGSRAELEVARAAARAAAEVLASRPARVDHKGRADLVTDVDRRAEAAIRAVFAAQTPDIPVLGEEEGGGNAPVRWVVDPIDGTTNFVHGFPFYATSIALEADGRSVVGVVLDVPRNRWFEAVRGAGAFVDGARLRVSDTEVLAQSLVATGFPYDRAERVDALLRPVAAVLRSTRGIRRCGAASLDLALVAAGALDAFFETGLGPWDVAAGALLVEEAGGRVTAHDGAEVVGQPTSPLATNGRVHDAMVALLSGA
ncbi:MAG: inositol monophosphatase family protein [Myxococcota bacterium]